MRYKKGQSGNPKGKPKGAENKIKKDIKQAYQMLIEKNLDNLTLWLDSIAQKEPEKAFKLIIELSEYVLPKHARIEANVKDERLDAIKKSVQDLFPIDLIETIKKG